MRIQTQGNSNKVWLSSEAGVINGTMTLSVTPLEKILQAVNEKYGTSFESWSQLPTAYEVGDTVPNWNAYEKIELPINRVGLRVNNDNAYFVFGTLDNGVFTMNVNAGSGSWISDSNGQILNSAGPPASAADYIIGQFARYSVNVTGVQANDVSFEIGENVPDWDMYTLYG